METSHAKGKKTTNLHWKLKIAINRHVEEILYMKPHKSACSNKFLIKKSFYNNIFNRIFTNQNDIEEKWISIVFQTIDWSCKILFYTPECSLYALCIVCLINIILINEIYYNIMDVFFVWIGVASAKHNTQALFYYRNTYYYKLINNNVHAV